MHSKQIDTQAHACVHSKKIDTQAHACTHRVRHPKVQDNDGNQQN